MVESIVTLVYSSGNESSWKRLVEWPCIRTRQVLMLEFSSKVMNTSFASEKLHIYIPYHTLSLVFNAQLWKHVNFLKNNYA